jgi:hypothetical protein
MTLIKLTHFVNEARKPLYLNTDQIVRIADSAGAGQGYRTSILLANGSQDVIETMEEVIQYILHPNVPSTLQVG